MDALFSKVGRGSLLFGRREEVKFHPSETLLAPSVFIPKEKNEQRLRNEDLVLVTLANGAQALAHARLCVCPRPLHCAAPLLGASSLLWTSLTHLSEPCELLSLSSLKPLDPAHLPKIDSIDVVSLATQHLAKEPLLLETGCKVLRDIPLNDSAEMQSIKQLLKVQLAGSPLFCGQTIALRVDCETLMLFRVTQLRGKASKLIERGILPRDTAYTLQLAGGHCESRKAQTETAGLESVGGSLETRQILERYILFPLTHPEVFFEESASVKLKRMRPPKGVLLYGLPGTGKSFVSQAVADELVIRWGDRQEKGSAWGCPRIVKIEAGSLLRASNGALAEIFEEAAKAFSERRKMTLLLIDEIDAICPKRELSDENANQLTAVLLAHLDGVAAHPGVMMLATTNRPDALDEAIRRPGRLDVELEMGVPSVAEREAILMKMLEKFYPSNDVTAEEALELCRSAHGFVAADLGLWVRKAVLLLEDEAFENGQTDFDCFTLHSSHLQLARKMVSPSALKELAIQVPSTTWCDIGGYEAVKQSLRECVEWPLKHWAFFEALNISAPRGILLYGPPGNSKTLMAKAVASESSMNFISVKGPEIFSKWVGESEKTIRKIFRKARQHSPTVIFFDEIDSLGVDRQKVGGGTGVESRVLSQMLNEMDGIGPHNQVVVIGATNRPDLLDAALTRPGRFDRLIYLPPPDREARASIFEIHLRGLQIEADSECQLTSEKKQVDESLGAERERRKVIEQLAAATERFSGAEISLVCTEARMAVLRRLIQQGKTVDDFRVHIRDLLGVISKTAPRTSPETLRFYETYARANGSAPRTIAAI